MILFLFLYMRKWNKVFEVGDPKTGTTSLGRAFEILGLKHKGWDKELHIECKQGNFDRALKEAEKFEAFEDAPWHCFELYKKFDVLFPNSKFILLERNINDWIKSHERHFSKDKDARGLSLIEDYSKKKQLFIDNHIKRYNKVKEYFKDRPDDLLIMDICNGEGWEKLCSFLDLPIPNEQFPFLNKTK